MLEGIMHSKITMQWVLMMKNRIPCYKMEEWDFLAMLQLKIYNIIQSMVNNQLTSYPCNNLELVELSKA